MADTKNPQNDDHDDLLLLKDEESTKRKSHSRGSGSSSRRHSSSARSSASSSSRGGRRRSSTAAHSRSSTTRSSGSRSHGTPDSKIKDDEKQNKLPLASPRAYASIKEHRSSKKTSSARSSGGSNDRHRSRNTDEKSQYPTRGSASVPGAQAELSSPRHGSRKSDEKDKERRSTRASKPGAEASTSSEHKSKQKSGGDNERDVHISRSIEDQPEKGKSDEQPVVAAMIVEEEKEDEDTKKERQQARIQEARIQEALAAERREMQAERQRMKEEMDRLQAERKEQERKAKKKRNATMILVVLFLIGGGIGAYFAGHSSGQSSTVSAQDPPANLQLKYGQPGLVECERIADGLPTIYGEDEMFDRSFSFPMEVELVPGNDINPLLPELETSIESLFLPDLIGCPRDLFARRRLGDRKLQTVTSIRYSVAKASVNVTVTSDSCETSRSPSCNVVSVTLNLKVRGEEPNILLMRVIGQVFPVGKDIRPDLELIAPFETIVVGVIRPLEPTSAPTLIDGAPGDKNSTSPSSVPDMGTTTLAPSQSPSSTPSQASVLGTTVPAPTEPPTKYPSKAPVIGIPMPPESPTESPSKSPLNLPRMAPTPTPPPTAAPQPGRTPPPTAHPSASPSRSPSKYPTRSPSLKPTPRPSPFPSIEQVLHQPQHPPIGLPAVPLLTRHLRPLLITLVAFKIMIRIRYSTYLPLEA